MVINVGPSIALIFTPLISGALVALGGMQLAFFLGVAWILYSREPVEEINLTSAEAPAVGYRAPDFTLQTLSGEPFTLSDQQGQPVVLNFWATWCPPCRAEIPFFQAASRKYNGQVIIAGVDDGEPADRVAPFVREMGITYPVPLDESGEISRIYRVSSLPETVFIDRNGVVQNIHLGIMNQAMLEERIGQLLEP